MRPLTSSAIPIDFFRIATAGDEVIGATGTAFIYERNGLYLITAWHNVTGCDYTTNQPLHTRGFVPDRARFGVWKRHGRDVAARQWISINLQPKECVWLQHKRLLDGIDIAAIPIDIKVEADWLTKPINQLDFESRLDPEPGLEAFVIGFPENISGPSRTAIWKRASVASEAGFRMNEAGKFYVDTATRRGMSGSPVIIQHSGFFDPNSRGGAVSPDATFGT